LDQALKRLEAMMERDDPAEDDEAFALMAVVKAYEDKHYPVGYPGPIEAIKFVMEQRAFTNKDLAKILGAQPRVSEIMNNKRPLSISMIRRLNEEWDISLLDSFGWLASYPQIVNNPGKVYVNSYMANAISISSQGDAWAFNPSEILPATQAGLFGPGPDGNEYTGTGYVAVGTSTSATEVQYPSELIMFSGGGTDQNAYWDILDGYPACGNTDNTEMEYCADDWDATWQVLFAAVNYFDYNPAPTTFIREYNQQANYVMADSSARSLRPGQLVEANLYLNQHRWVVQPGQ
jgi:HTH-type transcriptional regulator/antitoxin HigA